MSYLYGASIQGIQDFIFETNKLKEIVGASDLVDYFCSRAYLHSFFKDLNIELSLDEQLLRNAGGNIRIIFESEEDLKKVVKNFPQKIMLDAYGITVSQAVMDLENSTLSKEAMNRLEQDLKSARNQAKTPLDSKFSLMKQAPKTGKPAVKKEGDDFYDKGSYQKRNNKGEAKDTLLLSKLAIEREMIDQFPDDMEQISNKQNKVAVIHADGNGLGMMLQKMGSALNDSEIQEVYKTFSKNLEDAMENAVQRAFKKNFIPSEGTIPFRPVVIGGDDLTVICSADNALDFTKDFLAFFESETKEKLADLVTKYKLDDFKNGLTACAGISYCNTKFPFHYAVGLAEKLCRHAKIKSKEINPVSAPSSLMFHNIQSSYFRDYTSYIEDELTIMHGKKKLSLVYGPYFIKDISPTIDNLQNTYMAFSSENVPLGKYRAWLSELHKNEDYANLLLERINVIMKKKSKQAYETLNSALKELDDSLDVNTLISGDEKHAKTLIHDIMQLKSVLGGKV